MPAPIPELSVVRLKVAEGREPDHFSSVSRERASHAEIGDYVDVLLNSSGTIGPRPTK